jgi:hypothetical protein
MREGEKRGKKEGSKRGKVLLVQLVYGQAVC